MVIAGGKAGKYSIAVWGAKGGVIPLEHFSEDGGVDVESPDFAQDLKALDRGQVFAFANVAADPSRSR